MEDADRQLVQRVPLFLGLRPRQLQAFLRICRTMATARREVLCERGTSSTKLFILLAGKLNVLADDGTVLAQIAPVTTVGEMGFVSRKPRSATVQAAEASRLFVIEYHDFETLIESDVALSSRLYRNIARILAGRLSEANGEIARIKKLGKEGSPPSADTPEPEANDQASDEAEGPAGPAGEGEGAGPEEAGGGTALAATDEPAADPSPDHAPPPPAPEGGPDPDPAPPRRGPPVVLDEGETAQLVLDFYTRTDQEIDPAQLRQDQAVVAQLGRDGYTAADIEYAILWTVSNIPMARRFGMVGLSIREAFENR